MNESLVHEIFYVGTMLLTAALVVVKVKNPKDKALYLFTLFIGIVTNDLMQGFARAIKISPMILCIMILLTALYIKRRLTTNPQ